MLDALFANLRGASLRGRRRARVSIVLPFVIMSIGLGALAWRSYTLSVKTEQSARALAAQYAGYAAEITARRVDAAVRAEIVRAADEWQHAERAGDPTAAVMREWLAQHPWIVSAIYVPDYDPASSIYVSAIPSQTRSDDSVSREFFTSTGMVRYTYEPQRLIGQLGDELRQPPLARTTAGSGALAIQQQADVALVRGGREGRESLEDGFAFVSPLAPPLEDLSVRAVVRTASVGGKGWQNQRVMSLWMSLVALALTGAGAILAVRGMRKEAETMSIRGALIANVSHELRTPLSMIRLGAETLKRGKVSAHERAEIEDQILREVLLLSHLVENVLDIARMQNQNTKALAFTPVPPRDLIRNLVATYESWIRSKGFTVTLELDETIGQQMWDRDAVSRALLNLIDNAIKYSGEDERAIDIILRQTAEDVVIEVRDRGIGISASDATKIFEPYFRARFSDTITRRGAGLGLTLVHQIVASHGGRVEVESSLGAGATFRLLFPRDAGQDGAGAPAVAVAREAF